MPWEKINHIMEIIEFFDCCKDEIYREGDLFLVIVISLREFIKLLVAPSQVNYRTEHCQLHDWARNECLLTEVV